MLSILLIGLLIIAVQSATLYVNNNYPSSAGTGSIEDPFQLLKDALASITDPTTHSLTESTVTLVLSSGTTQSYDTGTVIYNLGDNIEFILRGDNENLSDADIDCNALPTVEFSSSNTLQIDNDLDVTLDATSLFVIQGVRIFIRADSTVNQVLRIIKAYQSVILQQVCIIEETTMLESPATQFFIFDNIASVLIQNSIILNQTYTSFSFIDISASVTLTNISIGMGVIPSDLSTYKTDALFNSGNSEVNAQFTATNLILRCDQTIGEQFQLTNLLIVSFFNSVSFESIEISNCNASLMSNFIIVLNSTTLSLRNLTLESLDLTTFQSSLNNSVFFKSIGNQNHFLDTITIHSSNFTYDSSIPTLGYPFDIFYFNVAKEDVNFTLKNLVIANTSFNQAFNKIMNIDIPFRFDTLDITSVQVADSLLNIRALFRITLPISPVVPDVIVWREMFDWYFTNTTFQYCYILNIDGATDVQIDLIEKEFYSLRNWEIYKCTFGVNEDESSDSFLTNQGAFLNMSNFTFAETTVAAHDGIGAKTNPSNFILKDSRFINNYFDWSFVIRNSIFTEPSVIYFTAPDFFTDDTAFKRMNRALLWQNVSVINNTFTTYAELFHVSAPLFALYNCTFINNTFHTPDDKLANIQPYYTLFQGWGYAGFISDPETEAKLYSYDSVMLDLLNGNTPGTAGIPADQVHRYIFENVVFDSVSMGNQVSLVSFHEMNVESCGIHFYNVTFSNYLSESSTNYTNFVTVNIIPYFRVENCSFSNISGYGIIIKVGKLLMDSILQFNDNKIDALGDLMLLSVNSEFLTQAEISGNQISNVFINQTLIQLKFQELRTSFEFSRNLFNNVAVYSSPLRAKSVNLLQLHVDRALNGENTTQSFFGCTLKDIAMNSSNEFANGISSNALFLVIGAQGLLNMTNFSFQNVSIANNDPLLTLSSNSILLDNWSLQDVSIVGSQGVINFIFSYANVTNSVFKDVVIGNLFGGALFHLSSATMNNVKFFKSHNNQFSNITSAYTPILEASNIVLGFDMQSCAFENIFLSVGPALSFYQASLNSFKTNNISVIYTLSGRSGTGSFLHFQNSAPYTDNASVSITNVRLQIDMLLYGYFFNVVDSPKLQIQVTNFTFEPSHTGIFQGGIQYGILQSFDAWVEFTAVSFWGYVVNQTYPIQINCGSSSVGTRLLLEQSCFRNITLSNFSAASLSTAFSPSLVGVSGSSSCAQNISIVSSNFTHITSWGNGTVVQNLQSGYVIDPIVDLLTISQSIFAYIEGYYGAVIFSASNNSTYSFIDISSSQFLNNTAHGEGGSIWSYYADLNVVNTNFTNNTATLNGGAIFLSLKLDKNRLLETNIFTNNDAVINIGDDYASPPESMVVDFSLEGLKATGVILAGTTFENISTHSLKTVPITVTLLDKFGQVFYDYSDQKTISFYLNSSFQYRVFTYRTCTPASCYFTPESLEVTGKAGEYTTMRVQYASEVFFMEINYTLVIRACLVGEINATNAGTCSACPQGKYSLKLTDEYCGNCIEGATCPGGNVLQVSPGFWRANTSSDVLIKCSSNDTCIGGNGTDICLKGYTGPICAQCDFANNYTRLSGNKCSVCVAVTVENLGIMLLSFLGLCAYQLLFVVVTFNSNRLYHDHFKATGERVIKIGPCLTLFTNYSQILSIVLALDSSLKDSLSFTNSFGDPATFMFLTLDCFLYSSGFTPLQVTYWKTMVSCLDPVAKWVLFQLCLFPFQKYFKRKYKGFKLSQLTVLSFITLFLMEQPGIVRVLLSIFNCKKLDTNSESTYLVSNVDVSCDSAEFQSFMLQLVIPFLIAWGAVIPGIIFAIMLVNKRKLRSAGFRISLGSMYNQFKEPVYYWGFISVIFKEALLLVINGLSYDEDARVILSGAILMLYYSFLKKAKPYHHDLLHHLEVYSINCAAWSVLLILLRKDSSTEAIKLISMYTLSVINVLMVFYFLIKGGSLMLDVLRQIKAASLRVLRKICPCFSRKGEQTSRKRKESASILELSGTDFKLEGNEANAKEIKCQNVEIRTLISSNSEISFVKEKPSEEKRGNEVAKPKKLGKILKKEDHAAFSCGIKVIDIAQITKKTLCE